MDRRIFRQSGSRQLNPDAPGPHPELSIESIKAPDPLPTPALRQLYDYEKDLYGVHTAGLRQDIAERKKYALGMFILSCFWILAIYTILILAGFRIHGFALSDSVLLGAIGGTTANILGMFFIVARYLFPKRPS